MKWLTGNCFKDTGYYIRRYQLSIWLLEIKLPQEPVCCSADFVDTGHGFWIPVINFNDISSQFQWYQRSILVKPVIAFRNTSYQFRMEKEQVWGLKSKIKKKHHCIQCSGSGYMRNTCQHPPDSPDSWTRGSPTLPRLRPGRPDCHTVLQVNGRHWFGS